MGKRFIQAATITCLLFLVMEVGSSPTVKSSSGSTHQVLTDDPETMFPALKAVFQ
jgi:hypothetical protein